MVIVDDVDAANYDDSSSSDEQVSIAGSDPGPDDEDKGASPEFERKGIVEKEPPLREANQCCCWLAFTLRYLAELG